MQTDILDEDVSRKVKILPQTGLGFKGQIGTLDSFVFISISLAARFMCRNQIWDEQSSLDAPSGPRWPLAPGARETSRTGLLRPPVWESEAELRNLSRFLIN